MTEDHTVYNELIKRGKLTREQIEKVAHKNAITRAVGVYERVEVDTLRIEVLPGDPFVLASDGLTGYLDAPDELAPVPLLEGDKAAKALIALANEQGRQRQHHRGPRPRRRRRGGRRRCAPSASTLKREALANMPLFGSSASASCSA